MECSIPNAQRRGGRPGGAPLHWKVSIEHCALGVLLLLSGCSQPLVAVQPGAVAPHLGEGNAPLVDVLSRLEKIEARIGTVEVQVHKATSQPIAMTDSGDTGANKTSVLANLNGGDWAVAVVVIVVACVAGAVAWLLLRSRNGYRRAVDALVSVNEDRRIGTEEKDRIQQKAMAHRAEPYLKARVNARRRRGGRPSGQSTSQPVNRST